MTDPASSYELGLRATITSMIQRGYKLETIDTLIKREYLSQCLKSVGNNQSATAEKIGVHRNTMHRYMDQYSVPYQRTWRNRKGKNVVETVV